MEKCLYTYVSLNDNNSEDDNSFSKEHIVPYALGGSDGFVIEYCSKKANNDFGRDIDSHFIALPLVGFKRHEYSIKSYSNTVPAIKFKGLCIELDKSCEIVFPHQDAVYADFGIFVDGNLSNEKIALSGDKDRVLEAAKGLLKKASKKGLNIRSANLDPINSVDDILSFSNTQTGQNLSFNMSFDNETFFVPWTRGILKIALGMGAKILGKTWAFSVSADKIRTALISDGDKLKDIPIHGCSTWSMPNELSEILGREKGKHFLAVLPQEDGMVALISLFGGELFDAIIHLGKEVSDVNIVNGSLPADWECIYIIDPITRAVKTRKLKDIDANLSNL